MLETAKCTASPFKRFWYALRETVTFRYYPEPGRPEPSVVKKAAMAVLPQNKFKLAKGEQPSPEMLHFAKYGTCPDCGSNDFYMGPRGGMAMNIGCANDMCGSWFNTCVWNHTLVHFDRISAPSPKKPKTLREEQTK